MSKEKLDKWVREHKKSFARHLIETSGAMKTDRPAAIFMAGLPGVGKTEFTKSWIVNSGLRVVRLDMDEIASQIEAYTPQKADKFRKSASTLLNRTFDMVVKDGYDFIMDGTFGGSSAVKDVRRVLKHGYQAKVLLIYQNPKIAWEYTVAREAIEHRAIDFEGFINTYYKIWDNLRELGEDEPAQVLVDLVVKDNSNCVKEILSSIDIKHIDDYVNIEYNREKLIESIHE